MITEDSVSDNNEKKPVSEEILNENSTENTAESQQKIQEDSAEKTAGSTSFEEPHPEHQSDVDTQKSTEIPQEKVLSEIDPEKTENGEPTSDQKSEEQTEAKSQSSTDEINTTENVSENTAESLEQDHHETEEVAHLSLPEILNAMENIITKIDAAAHRNFNALKEQANQLIQHESDSHHSDTTEENEKFQHPSLPKLSELINVFRTKNDEFNKKQEESHGENLKERQNIIEKLKNLYTNTEPGTNLFKAIREIKDEWKNAGQVAKSEFKLLNNNYFHHLNQFYQMLDLNKEYMEQEFAHNLEKRQHIIARAKELETEPSVQKSLNELQYLHKLWREEAEPVAEEFREKTWEEFKEISNKIHERKTELSDQIEKEQTENLEKKNKIIEEIKKITSPEKEPNHAYWQNSIKKIEDLRTEFLKLGSVPRKISNQNWNEFKTLLRNFNTTKNEFYKGLKNSQQTNLDEKLKLIQTAKDNMLSEDWETTVPLFKKLQDDWKKIGHVPRNMTNKVWDDFREACNTFFNNYREKNDAVSDNWKENYKNKRQLLDELKEIGEAENSVEKIEEIKNKWNAIGKVPREKLSINTEFNKTLREKLKLNKINEYDLKEENLSENQVTDKARKIKNQIADLEAEISKMENNLGFFSNSSRENPLLKDTYERIDEKKSQLESMKQSLHQILAGENQ